LQASGASEEVPPAWLIPSEEVEATETKGLSSDLSALAGQAEAKAEAEVPTKVGTKEDLSSDLSAEAKAEAEVPTKVGTKEEVQVPKVLVSTPEVEKKIVFRDVAESHWAYTAVYDLIKLGITQGYPDGTFRGDKKISRYEMAMFVSRLEKLVVKLYLQADESRKEELEKKRKEIKEELDKLKAEIEELKKPPEKRPEFGMFLSRLRVGNLTSGGSVFTSPSLGPRLDYRLMASGKKAINDQVELKVNFDTMDMGWGGGRGGFAQELIDLEGNIKLGDIYKIKLTVGPGTIVHSEPLDGIVPSDNGIAFVRPKNSVDFLVDFENSYIRGGFKALSVSTSGEAGVNNLNLCIGQRLKDAPLSLKDIYIAFDYNFKNRPWETISKEKLHMLFSPLPGVEIDGTLAISSFTGAQDNSYYGFGIKLENIIEEETMFALRGHRAGREYLNYPNYLAEDDWIGANFFDKLIYTTSEGITDIGVEIIHTSGNLKLEAKADVQMTGDYKYGKDYADTNSTFEIGVYKETNTYSSIGLIYRIFHFPSSPGLTTSDLVGIIAKYEF